MSALAAARSALELPLSATAASTWRRALLRATSAAASWTAPGHPPERASTSSVTSSTSPGDTCSATTSRTSGADRGVRSSTSPPAGTAARWPVSRSVSVGCAGSP